MLSSLLRAPYTLPILSGLLAALAFNNAFLWWLSFGALVPFFLFLFHENSRSRVFAGGLIFGFIFFGATISWFLSAHPLTWAGIESPIFSILVVSLVWILSVAVMSAFAGFFALSVRYLLDRDFGKTKITAIFLIPALWVIFEYLRAWGFNIFWAGPGSFISPHWTVGFLGYPLAENILLLSLAGIGGVYLLSFFVVFVNVSAALFVRTRQRAFAWVGALGIALALTGGLYVYHAPVVAKPPLSIAVAHSNVPSTFQITAEEYQEYIAPLKRELFALLESSNPLDIILLPEDLRILGSLLPEEQHTLEQLRDKDSSSLIVDSATLQRPLDGKVVSSMIYYDTKRGTIGRYDKMFIVPQGEYLSFLVRAVALLGGQGEWVAQFDENRSRVKGAGPRAASFKQARVGVLFCSEIVADNLYADAVNKQGAEILANASSHTVFGGNPLLAHQTHQMARVRAVENNRPFILAGNGTPAFILDHRGQLVAQTPEKLVGAASFITATVTPVTNSSLYNRVGNWILLLSFLLVGMAGYRSFAIRKGENRD